VTRLALLADLHFGTVAEALADSLAADIEAAGADMVVIAGDLTQRARSAEWSAAVAWVERLGPPTLIVPGNHDLPSFNLVRRFARPMKRFRRHFPGDGELSRGEVCVVGLNSAARWQPHLRWQEGRMRRRDIARLDRRLAAATPCDWRVVATHHPFAAVPGMPRARPMRRSRRALALFARHGVSLMLSGHTHRAFLLPVPVEGGAILSVGAPTALSSRMRGEPNGYWLVDFGDTTARLSLRTAPDGAYRAAEETAAYRWQRGAAAVEKL
jgi:3',5'-cyclic AMP phosphodiesterase CpdA